MDGHVEQGMETMKNETMKIIFGDTSGRDYGWICCGDEAFLEIVFD